jgi:hypothetical protein
LALPLFPPAEHFVAVAAAVTVVTVVVAAAAVDLMMTRNGMWIREQEIEEMTWVGMKLVMTTTTTMRTGLDFVNSVALPTACP